MFRLHASLRLILPFAAIPILIGLVLFLIDDSPQFNESEEVSSTDTKPFRIGTISENAVKQIKRAQPTADYIAKHLSDSSNQYHGEVVIVKTVDEMVSLLKNHEIDLYYDSPLIAQIVAKKANTEPILIRWKENTSHYYSVIFVRSNSSILTISDLKGTTAVFEDPASSSGYLLPKATLRLLGYTVGLDKASDINYIFSMDDENTPIWVLEGRGDLGSASNIDFEEFPENIKQGLRIIAESEKIPRHVIVPSPSLDRSNLDRVITILTMMKEDKDGKKIMSDFQKTADYTAVDSESRDNVKTILSQLEDEVR